MADHSELMAEMALVEKMSTQERLKHARKRRLQQMKKWSQREKEYSSKRKKTEQNLNRKTKKNDYKIHFVPSVMLLEAAARNDIEEVRRLLMLGVSPDSTNEDGLTALHQCCIDDSEEMMKLLIEFGANVNAKDSEQWTPLHAAATCGHLHLVKYLIAKNADLLAVNADGNMPYDICEDDATLDYIESEMAKRGVTQEMIDETRAATERQMLADLKLLAENGEDLEYRDHQGATPLHIAAANGYLSVVEYLLDQHVSTDSVDNDQWQPVHAAACWGHPDVIEMLVQSGADLNARTKNGETPYDICEDPDLRERIIQLKSEMEIKRAAQPQKLRRSHSQNTRSQSVRRTSIREKTQISRREAREEARLRQEKQEEARTEEDDEAKQQQDIQEFEKENGYDSSVDLEYVELSATPVGNKDTLQRLKGRPVKEVADIIDETEHPKKELSEKVPSAVLKDNANQRKESNVNVNQEIINQELDPPPDKSNWSPVENEEATDNTLPSSSDTTNNLSVPARSQGESVKVEIHVTVNTSSPYSPSPGTLADLKKQRAEVRHRNSLTLSQQDLPNTSVEHNGHQFIATYSYDPVGSRQSSLRRYRSNPSEIVGEPTRRGCCVLM
ncbi:protein phosphatase 1 regulatory subunit 16A-like [Limulus polyphemus]|uniref:Protein phosphatase 1 regulatory subunit 16A-like n=1 Tax=Limulus polyphemus TaxID=6850 RepID=A0ABM1TKI1_LIMPO|nr:protein phosphatase 1 regulatory subunit 16A-like [Limulus polyphemus]